jgi:hypothetical protein
MRIWTEFISSGHGPVRSFSEHGNGSSGFIISKENLENLRHY